MNLLDVQEARLARTRALMSQSDAALAKADEAKANLSILRSMEDAGPLHYPQTKANIIAEWEYWTCEARRLHSEAVLSALSSTL